MCACFKYANLVEIATCIFVHSDVKNAVSQSPQYNVHLCVHQHNHNTDISEKLTEIYGAANQGVPGENIHNQ